MNGWKNRGVWILMGAALGYGASAILPTQPVSATATSGGFEGTLIATGRSQLETIDLLWMIDDRGMLSCFLMGLQGRVTAATPLDLKQAIKGKGGKKGKYAMVTGRYAAQGQVSDVLYVTESSSNSVAVFSLTNDGIRLVNTLSAVKN